MDIGAGWGGLIARVARERPDLTEEGFERELPRDVRLVSAVFAVRGWTPARTMPVPDMHRSRVYVYELK